MGINLTPQAVDSLGTHHARLFSHRETREWQTRGTCDFDVVVPSTIALCARNDDDAISDDIRKVGG